MSTADNLRPDQRDALAIAIQRIEAAMSSLTKGDSKAANRLLNEARSVVSGVLSGDRSDEPKL
jgi:hypothetical protein